MSSAKEHRINDNSLSPPPAKKRKAEYKSNSNSFTDNNSSGEMAHNGSTNADAHSIDEGLYSRQLYVLGHEAMRRMQTAEVLICGAKGLGIEVAKNIILSGVKSVTIHDTDNCEIKDLSSQYYLKNSDIGKNRALASLEQLRELNSYVTVHAHTELLSEDFLKKFKVIVLTDSSLQEQYSVGEFAHNNGCSLIIADTKGLFGQIFCDFGENFTVYDVKGEQPLSAMIASISKDKNSVVTCLEETRHGFEDGDYVTFSEVTGMVELNGCEPRKVQVFGPYTFGIGDTSNFSDYNSGGVATQVNMPKKIHFKSFNDAINEPDFIMSDFAKLDRPPQLHLAFQAAHMYKQKNNRLPKPWSEEDAEEFLSIVKEINSKNSNPVELDENIIRNFSYTAEGDVSPMQTVIGGITAQEIMKACSGKYHPIVQWLYFDACECLPESGSVKELAQPGARILSPALEAIAATEPQVINNPVTGTGLLPNRQSFTTKVPKFLANKWEKSSSSDDLGTMELGETTSISLNPSSLNDSDLIPATTFNLEKVNEDNCVFIKSPEYEASVKKFSLKAVEDDKYIQRQSEVIQKKNKSKILVTQAHIEKQNKRMPEEVLRQTIIKAFEQKKYWTFKELLVMTRQPEKFLREVLKQICVYNAKNPHR